MEIHKTRKRVCSPLAALDGLLANGHSTDLPAALTELMGILVNEGRKNSTMTIRQRLFAEGTPLETLVAPQTPETETSFKSPIRSKSL